MAFTVGLIRELNFISELTGLPVEVNLCLGSNLLCVGAEITNSILTIKHDGEVIWIESLNDETSNFGLESCYRISQILKQKHAKTPYQHLIYKENA